MKNDFKFINIIKNTTILILSLLTFLYGSAYFLAPYFINKKDIAVFITKTIEKETGLVVLIDKHKLSVSPRLDVRVSADNISVFYKNQKQFLDIDDVQIELSPLAFIKKEILIHSVKADKIQLSTKLLKNGKTTLQTYLEENISSTTGENVYKFSSKVPSIKISEYLIKIKDEKSSNRLKIEGQNFSVTQNPDFRYITLETQGKLFVKNENRITYDTKFEIPKDLLYSTKIKTNFSLDEFFKQKYKANIKANAKIYSKDSEFDYINGTASVNNFVLYIGDNALPPSYFNIKANKGIALIDSKFYTDTNEITDINAEIKLKKPYNANIKFDCPKADISNLQRLSITVLELLNIKNNLAEFKANGQLMANFNINWNSESLKSKGNLKISKGSVLHTTIPLVINSVNADIDFSNDKINIKNSSALINNQPIKIYGHVLSNTDCKLHAKADNLDLKNIIKAFPFIKINNDVSIKTGKLSFNVDLNGKISEITPIVNAVVTNLSGSINSIKSSFTINNINIVTKITKNKPNGDINLSNLSLKSYNSNSPVSLKSNLVQIHFDDKNLKIIPSKLTTGNANVTLSGDVKNYAQHPDISVNAMGTVDTNFLKSLVPADIQMLNKGYLPIRATIHSIPFNSDNLDIDLKVLANQTNYITPFIVKNFSNKTTLTHLKAIANKKDISISDLSIYYAQNINSLSNDINVSGLKKAFIMRGKIKNFNTEHPILEDIKLITQEPLNIELPYFINSYVSIFTDVIISISADKKINANGIIKANNINIPDYMFSVSSMIINLKSNNVFAKLNNVKLSESLLNIESQSLIPSQISKINKIDNLKISADFIDFEIVSKTLIKLFQSQYAPGADLPIEITTGKLNVKSFKMGDITSQNIVADFSQKNNLVSLKNLSGSAYGGKIAGLINYNLLYNSISAKLQGRNLNAETATTALLPKEQKICGSMDFDADITAIGTTFEQQMKSLNGRTDFIIKNGYFGQLGRFEHFLYAQNLLSQKLIYASLNSAKQAISPQDTGRFTVLKGMAKFSKGYVHLNPVTTSGPQMSMYITGRINMLNNNADLKILGRVSSEVSSSMGLLGQMTIKDFIDEHTKYGQQITELFNSYNSELPEVDISRIPTLAPDLKYQTKNFQVLINGDAKSVKAVKSFTWVNPLGWKKQLNNLKPESASVNTESKNETQESNNQSVQQRQQTQPSESTPNFLDSIPDSFN